MLDPLDDLDHEAVLESLSRNFGVSADQLIFVPVGEDSWSYRAQDFWISVRRDIRGHVPEAYEAAAQLFAGGADYVVAPCRARDGAVVLHIGHHRLVVFSYVQGELLSAQHRMSAMADAADALERLHSSSVRALVPEEDFRLTFEAELSRGLALAFDGRPTAGPYAERLWLALRRNRAHILSMTAEYHELARKLVGHGTFVLTHGQPTTSNMLLTSNGFRIVDWGDLAWGPPERDWFHLARTANFPIRGRPDFLRLYHLKWCLSEIAEYASLLGARHGHSHDSAAMWQRLTHYLPA